MIMKLEMIFNYETYKEKKHPKCLGWVKHTPNGSDSDCDYHTKLICEECKYGTGRKDPAAKCNQS